MRGRLLLLIALGMPALAAAADPTPWEKHAERENRWREDGLTLIPYRANYFFPFTYNTSPHATSENDPKHVEAKFQLSFKVLILENLWYSDTHLFFGYTQLSLWQVYDRDRSAPFRDTNYEPELFFSFESPWWAEGTALRQFDIGVNHQSNGRSLPDSRGWNRVFANAMFDLDWLLIGVKPWVYLSESGSRRENPDITDYMGYGELTASFGWKNHVLAIMGRNNFDFQKNRGALRVDYSFPLTRILTGMVQYFTGYGESLIDYNRPNNRFSLGIALSDWR